ncbi:hypothetical protein CC1G_04846 [Coprinopsis cinerea okayama7|uniref:Uncharacterized protein n=1 Tax=Coprinopsis cinerea (strain Okayama-7 / 130 / ATCC MYA-4618 / FGSC 9003) TaxID=240176 RepID=A8PFS7_COPC7|nr:hypothetical protein CC1G_04846 [Coprinopsis cinerea okayama7\|eukprot:XP_001841002.2 hypothetical protein CC1G_04846 [Coprinopsis cinerea okayama7\
MASQIVHHYDVVFEPESLQRPPTSFKVIDRLMDEFSPGIFPKKVAFDGRKNLVSPGKLKFNGGANAQTFVIILPFNGGSTPGAPVHVRLTHVQEINLEALDNFTSGFGSQTSESITGITVSNIVLRMAANLRYPHFGKHLFIEELGMRSIGGGIELWRGLFQSLRPGIEGLYLNVDLATGMMYKRGTLLDVGIDILDIQGGNASLFTPGHLNFRIDKIKEVEQFITGIQVTVPTTGDRKRRVLGLSTIPANADFFDNNGVSMSVVQYFSGLNHFVQYPGVICARVGSSSTHIPLELCTVTPGQIIRKEVPQNKTDAFVSFARQRPQSRFSLIENGAQLVIRKDSAYLEAFGIDVGVGGPGTAANGLLEVDARKLKAPVLTNGSGSLNKKPAEGPSWNMYQRKVYAACPPITDWVFIVYEVDSQFSIDDMRQSIHGLKDQANRLGIRMDDPRAKYHLNAGTGSIPGQLFQKAKEFVMTFKRRPQLFVVVLPQGGDEIRIGVKHFGNFINPGIATQCLKGFQCRGARPQYWANVMIQVNGKLGGIHAVPNSTTSGSLVDEAIATMLIGADVTHPPPGDQSKHKPSFAAIVWSWDRHYARYRARDSIQRGREEIIQHMKPMAKEAFDDFKKTNGKYPRRVIVLRDGVSESQFREVQKKELAMIKEVLRDLKIKENDCKITYIIVGKRHHIRFNASDPKDRDKSGNAPAGTVIDTDNKFTADGLQQAMHALCYGYASATRALSIPIPIYCKFLVYYSW